MRGLRAAFARCANYLRGKGIPESHSRVAEGAQSVAEQEPDKETTCLKGKGSFTETHLIKRYKNLLLCKGCVCHKLLVSFTVQEKLLSERKLILYFALFSAPQQDTKNHPHHTLSIFLLGLDPLTVEAYLVFQKSGSGRENCIISSYKNAFPIF